MTSAAITVTAPSDIPEVTESTDLTDLIAGHLDLRDGDIVVVTSKVVSKAEGRVVTGDRDALIAAETVEVIARRDNTLITRSASGLVQAAAGVDGSNVPAGTVVLLPQDPDESARRLRTGLAARANVAVIVTDTAGRAWRVGQTDIAIGAAGIQVLDSYDNPTYADGQAGALYGQKPPLVNACRPPGQWQTYDIVFVAPRFQADGSVQSPARVTVLHNGIVVQLDEALLGATGHRALAKYEAHGPKGPIKLQDHGDPVRFRNVWVRPLQLERAAPK